MPHPPSGSPELSPADFASQLAERSCTTRDRLRLLLLAGAADERWSSIVVAVGERVLVEGLPCCEAHFGEALDAIHEETQRARWLVSHYDASGARRPALGQGGA